MADFEPYLQAEPSGTQLKQTSVKSGLVTFAAQPVKLVMGIGATAILSRLVTPADFGLLALVTPLLALVDSLSNLGMETATVQKQTLNHQQASAAFWFSFKVNVVVIAAMIAMGPVLAWFYDQPALSAVTLAMAVGALSLCLSFQHKSLLRRQMRFSLLTGIEVGSIAIATLCAIAAARLGLGYWALVLQIVVMQVLQSAAYWITCGWRPSLALATKGSKGGVKKGLKKDSASSDGEMRSLLSYGANLTGFRFITRIGMQMDRILLGYISGTTALGFYDVSYRWAYFPFMQVYAPLFDVAVSSLSRAYADPVTYRKYCRWGMMPLFALCLPALAFLWVTATEVLLILLGEQWLPAVPIFRLLLIAMFVGSLSRVTKWLYISSGQTRRQLRWGLIHTPIMIGSVAVGAHWGAYGIAVGYTSGMCLLTWPSVLFCLKESPLTVRDFLSVVWPAATAALVSAGGLLLVQPLLIESLSNSFVRLCVEGLLFSGTYCTLWFLLPGGRASTTQIIAHFFGRRL